jgi:lysine 2,3-aminomutase
MNKALKQQLLQDDALRAVTEKYAVSVTDDVLDTMAAHTTDDPVGKQYIPDAAELITTPEERDDPIGDDDHSPVKGIVHRYPDRALLKPVHVCAVYCRFCFRREKVGPGSETLSSDELAAALDYIRKTPAIWEVIVTGGDPFVLSPRRLKEIVAALNDIPHVQVIRFHTRVPVADPSRVTDDMLAALDSAKAVYIVYHVNHVNELTDKVRAVTQRFICAGIPLLSQSTLLKGVNDKTETLERLFRALTAMKIKPYYLHHPDKAPGTSHFRMTVAEGQAVAGGLWGKMSGIAQPHYVLDIPGGFGKVPIGKSWVSAEDKEGEYHVTDPAGRKHKYR